MSEDREGQKRESVKVGISGCVDCPLALERFRDRGDIHIYPEGPGMGLALGVEKISSICHCLKNPR